MWELSAVERVYRQPLLALIEQAHAAHEDWHPRSGEGGEVQLCHLLSIKTGGCPEDCAYCPQSARYATEVEAGKLMGVEEVVGAAERAKAAGSTRFCMGAAWRHVKDGPEFEQVLGMVSGVAELGLEVCCTLGMLTAGQAEKLAAAGLTAYNHNLDTSPEFYGQVITTRTYEDRLRTIENVRQAGISVCCGGILGLGEGEGDRIRLLWTLANLTPPPESVPINALVAVEGTPLAQQAPVNAFEFVRAIATARILMPKAKVRLSAGRLKLSDEAQALCFYAGANSIFVGDKLLTTANPGFDHDHALLATLGLRAEKPAGRNVGEEAPGPGSSPGSLEEEWARRLEQAEGRGRRRELRQTEGEDFCSNDYLGLAGHEAVRKAMAGALAAGMEMGATGSRLVRGNHWALEKLERSFAAWVGTETSLLYSSGYAASVGVLTALMERGDVVFSDELNHASLIDGMRLSGAQRVVVPHMRLEGERGLERLEAALRRNRAERGRRRFLVTESLFSMEGDLAPLEAMAELCRKHQVAMIVDEAHATGLFGVEGAGRVTAAMGDVVAARLHPCGKALGGSGALVAGSKGLCAYLVNHSRSFVYSTAPSPLLAVQLEAAIEVSRKESWRREKVLGLARELRGMLRERGLETLGAEMAPIIPVILGEDGAAVRAAAALMAAGLDVRAIRPPTVAEGTARLRVTVHAGQSSAQLRRLADALAVACSATLSLV